MSAPCPGSPHSAVACSHRRVVAAAHWLLAQFPPGLARSLRAFAPRSVPVHTRGYFCADQGGPGAGTGRPTYRGPVSGPRSSEKPGLSWSGDGNWGGPASPDRVFNLPRSQRMASCAGSDTIRAIMMIVTIPLITASTRRSVTLWRKASARTAKDRRPIDLAID